MGGHWTFVEHDEMPAGSSPRMRGARGASNRGFCRRGDHPHVCGEHRWPIQRGRTCGGSSPRMRGAPGGRNQTHPHTGIIPAYAGSTTTGNATHTRTGDHPRVCGEHVGVRQDMTYQLESSPRMRGALNAGIFGLDDYGIIPAYAGSTRGGPRRSGCSGDHPRVCGEHRADRRGRRRVQGSSPRMRGAPIRRTEQLHRDGIIPAYAGSTENQH